MSDFTIPLRIRETKGLVRSAEAIRTGVPLPAGLVRDPGELGASMAGRPVPFQARPLAYWGDRSIKWLLVDTVVPVAAASETSIEIGRLDAGAPAAHPVIRVARTESCLEVDTGPARFDVPLKGTVLLARVMSGHGSLLGEKGVECSLVDGANNRFTALTETLVIEEAGDVRTTLLASGGFAGAAAVPPLRFTARLVFIAGAASIEVEFRIWNPQPALHPGGLWDLGDPGSCHFRDLSIVCHAAKAEGIEWYSEDPARKQLSSATSATLYQDSSGGERWNSPNHVDRNSRLTVTFRGYRVTEARDGAPPVETGNGDRATPGFATAGPGGIGVAVRDFWQSFPKALRWRKGALHAALFPEECVAGFELQGGEQKRHVVVLDFDPAAGATRLHSFQNPVEVTLDPGWVEHSGAVSALSAAAPDDDAGYRDYINQILTGPHSFLAKREVIDEYGWRNFGDLYADHEAVHHVGPEPFISHYNNQYDFIYGAFFNYLRTGDSRWRGLMLDSARHSIDIDIYRTDRDRVIYNGGLFWHTDHYKPAVTSTHRTYSKANAGGGNYGGGPANEQDYSSGFLACYFLTGDPEAANTVRMLADWVCAMDDGAQNLFAIVDEGPTGFASASRDRHYHGPGRGAGNSINTLMDAYAVSGDRRYWFKAEELIRRCIHPADDIASLQLDDPENRWSYLVFLQVLGKYLGQKLEQGETDYMFWYARDSLLHYARWVLANEVPYKDVLHKVELPTETWPAHDIRKCHVLHLAALYGGSTADADSFRNRAEFFFRRCLQDLLGFPTAHFTRPLVILCVYGGVHDYFRKATAGARLPVGHGYSFGKPEGFEPQRARLGATLRRKARLVRDEVARILRQKLQAFRNR